ncbi:MAG: YcxB family protein [Clostridia bacterium]|nr:YcxB family protein [Clostridia bacterium]
MKNFSIDFSLTKSDYKNFYKTINKSLLLQRLKFTAIALTVTFILTAINLYSLAVTSFFLMFILFFIGDIINRIYIMRMNDRSRIGKRKTTVDFYNDHFEIINYPDEYFKGKSERHYPLDTVKMVLENENYVYFKLEDYTTLIIPKRYIQKEEYTKIRNMIDNLYPDRFLEE